ncbi:MAG: DegV family protein [Oscillibacter sp.]|jgi:DegV family protein with EDD domain|nr:DegV family protein [Oscillibacter sp.]
MTRIIVDSTCDLPQAFAEEYGIVTLPLHVHVEDREYLDGVTITTNEVYAAMRRGAVPTTSQVSMTDAYDTLAALAEAGDDLLYLAFSAKMSGTFALISHVLEEVSTLYPERRLRALDARGGSFATGLIAMEAAKAAKAGMDFADLTNRCKFLISHVEHVFVISDLTWMIRGGRVSKTMGYTANLLDIKPVLDVSDGEMEVIQKVRGRLKSMKRVAEIVAERAKNCPRQTIGITHADDLPAAETMRDLLAQKLPECDFLIEEIGAVLGVHLGIGGVGVFFFNQM